VLNTSKTAAELRPLSHASPHPYPYIVENGAAVVVPKGCDLLADIGKWSCNGRSPQTLFAPHRSGHRDHASPLA